MPYTVEQAKAYIKEHQAEMLKSLADSKEVPASLALMPGMQTIWCSGCWLGRHLEGAGATDQQIQDIQFAHGQRCFGGDPVAVAVAYVNEFLETKTVADKPGPELAEKINAEVFG